MPTSRLVRAGGHQIALHEAGSGPRTAVLVHGIGVSARYFGPLARALARTHRVLAPDLPGFGRSPRPRRVLSIGDHARVLADLVADHVTAAGLGRPVLVAHSMGVQVVTQSALARPGTAAALVLVGPVVDPDAPTVTGQGLRLLRDARHENATVNGLMVRDWLRCGPRRYLATAPSMRDYPLEARLAAVEQPVVLVRGALDPVAPEAYVRHLAAACRRGEVVELPGEGHVAMYRGADAVARVCRRVSC